MAKINIAGHLTRGDIDHDHVAAISSRFADAGVSIYRNIGSSAIGRRRDLMPRDAAFRYGSYLLTGRGINDAKVTISLVGYEQSRLTCTAVSGLST